MQSMNPIAVGQAAYEFLRRHPMATAPSAAVPALAGKVG
jgi:hypothetical protein